MVGNVTEGGKVATEGVVVGGAAGEALTMGAGIVKLGNQIPKIVIDVAYRRLEKKEDNNSKREQEQEPEDRWMTVSGLKPCL